MSILEPNPDPYKNVYITDKLYFTPSMLISPLAFVDEFSYLDEETNKKKFLFNFYSSRNLYALPKGYLTSLIPHLHKDIGIVSKEVLPVLHKKLEFIGTLKPEQESLVSKWNLSSSRSGVIVARAGFGKTVIGSKLIADYSTPTIVLVPTLRILTQWKQSIHTFLNVRAGIIGTGVFDVKDITVASYKSLLKPDKQKEVVKRFGLVVIDEAHKAPAPELLKLSNSFYATYKVGFTATPYRKDGKHFHFLGLFGDNYVEQESINEKASISIIPTNFVFPFGGTSSYQDALMTVARNIEFNRLVAYKIKDDYDNGRHIIVLTPRLEHIENIRKELEKLGVPCGHLISETTATDKKSNNILLSEACSEIRKVILTTDSLAGTGFDLPILDCMHVPYSFNNEGSFIQFIGRIERPYKDKRTPKYVSYQFKPVMITASQQRSMMNIYEKNKYAVYINV